MKNNDFAKGCLVLLPLPFLLVWFLDITISVTDGNAPTWKIVVFISGMVIYGLAGGLGKAFEAGFSRKNFPGLKRKEIETENEEEKTPIFMLILVVLVFGGIFVATFMAFVN